MGRCSASRGVSSMAPIEPESCRGAHPARPCESINLRRRAGACCARSSGSATPPSTAPLKPRKPKAGRPNSVGPACTVITIEEPMISAAITSASEPVGGAVELVADALQVREVDVQLHAAAAQVAHRARDVLRQALGHRQRAAQRLPGALPSAAGLVACAQHLAQHRQRLASQWKPGSRPRPMPSSEMKALMSSARSAGRARAVLAQDGGHVGQHLAEVQAGQRRAVVLVDEGLDLGFQRLEVSAVAVARPVEATSATACGSRCTRPSSSASSSSRRQRGDRPPTMPKSMKARRLPLR